MREHNPGGGTTEAVLAARYTLTDKGHAAVDQIRRGHFAVADLTGDHFGREITAAGLTGTLVGLIPAGDRVQLALIVGGAHVWSDLLPGDTAAEVAEVAS